jgi:hypothetical protein
VRGDVFILIIHMIVNSKMEESKKGAEMQLSLVNVLRLELMEKCNCNKGFEVIYFCKSRSCPDHEK